MRPGGAPGRTGVLSRSPAVDGAAAERTRAIDARPPRNSKQTQSAFVRTRPCTQSTSPKLPAAISASRRSTLSGSHTAGGTALQADGNCSCSVPSFECPAFACRDNSSLAASSSSTRTDPSSPSAADRRRNTRHKAFASTGATRNQCSATPSATRAASKLQPATSKGVAPGLTA